MDYKTWKEQKEQQVAELLSYNPATVWREWQRMAPNPYKKASQMKFTTEKNEQVVQILKDLGLDAGTTNFNFPSDRIQVSVTRDSFFAQGYHGPNNIDEGPGLRSVLDLIQADLGLPYFVSNAYKSDDYFFLEVYVK